MATKKNKPKKKKEERVRLEAEADPHKIAAELNNMLKGKVATAVENRSSEIHTYSSGILSLDRAVGNNGFLAGRVINAYGREGSGKTLNVLSIGAYIQRCGGLFAFVDAEGTWNDNFAAQAGVDVDKVILVEHPKDRPPLSGEEFFAAIEHLVQRQVHFIGVDSCPALVPSLTFNTQVGEGQKAQNAQLMSSGLQKLTPIVSSYGRSCVWFINQIRLNIAIGGGPSMGPKEKSTGGTALRFYASYMFECRKIEDIIMKVVTADGLQDTRVGARMGIQIVKNKTSGIPMPMPGKIYHLEYDIMFTPFTDENGIQYASGVDVIKDYVEVGIATGIIQQAGAWYNVSELKCQGKVELIKQLRVRPDVMQHIRDAVLHQNMPLDEAAMAEQETTESAET